MRKACARLTACGCSNRTRSGRRAPAAANARASRFRRRILRRSQISPAQSSNRIGSPDFLMRSRSVRAYAFSILMCAGIAASAQDIEPRQFSNAPVGVNFLLAGYAYTRGGLALDPALPITNTNLQT